MRPKQIISAQFRGNAVKIIGMYPVNMWLLCTYRYGSAFFLVLELLNYFHKPTSCRSRCWQPSQKLPHTNLDYCLWLDSWHTCRTRNCGDNEIAITIIFKTNSYLVTSDNWIVGTYLLQNYGSLMQTDYRHNKSSHHKNKTGKHPTT